MKNIYFALELFVALLKNGFHIQLIHELSGHYVNKTTEVYKENLFNFVVKKCLTR